MDILSWNLKKREGIMYEKNLRECEMGFQGKDTIPCNWEDRKLIFYEHYTVGDPTTNS